MIWVADLTDLSLKFVDLVEQTVNFEVVGSYCNFHRKIDFQEEYIDLQEEHSDNPDNRKDLILNFVDNHL